MSGGAASPVAVPGLPPDHGDDLRMTATVMQALDTTIANVALPICRAAVASQDQSWGDLYIVAARS